MKDFLGFILALICDARWYLAALALIGFFAAFCPLAHAAESDNDIIAAWQGTGWQLVIQRGSNGCAAGTHYVFVVDSGEFSHGCALSLPNDGWHIEFAGGGSFTIPGKDSLKPWRPGPGNLHTPKDIAA